MTLPLYPDGCIIPNIQTKHYLVYFAPKCEHTKLRGAYIGIDAPSADDALIYASESIRLAHLTPVSVAEYHDYLDTERENAPFTEIPRLRTSVECPHCHIKVFGNASDIDSGLRKHVEYCEFTPEDDLVV